MAFYLIPEILNFVNMVMIFRKMRTMIYAKMTKFAYIKHIIIRISICVDAKTATWHLPLRANFYRLQFHLQTLLNEDLFDK
ncbi:hypothetical protein SA3033_00355 [Aggregatibacter actinomycetemcomitans serotype d str. SA3033]|nr:hypothetical protein SA2876_06030 [Aggregatibacter actinomycetemcomitans serotype e str. SA2876]KYK84922.1 hypothetical protein SA3033_00355 [Aggregatibacter actinomycetemcomitans serotype d str. SA3033]KYK86225.1 hypothetical protein SC29R_10025 [Aggregatibacter actinomycetemcomitans serotype f str. SC29R]